MTGPTSQASRRKWGQNENCDKRHPGRLIMTANPIAASQLMRSDCLQFVAHHHNDKRSSTGPASDHRQRRNFSCARRHTQCRRCPVFLWAKEIKKRNGQRLPNASLGSPNRKVLACFHYSTATWWATVGGQLAQPGARSVGGRATAAPETRGGGSGSSLLHQNSPCLADFRNLLTAAKSPRSPRPFIIFLLRT